MIPPRGGPTKAEVAAAALQTPFRLPGGLRRRNASPDVVASTADSVPRSALSLELHALNASIANRVEVAQSLVGNELTVLRGSAVNEAAVSHIGPDDVFGHQIRRGVGVTVLNAS